LTSLFLRGGQSKYVKVLVDGVPVNEPGGAFDFAHLTTDNVERIEVLRGPASVLYGSDAVTGVVQIVTRRGVGTARAAASVAGGGLDNRPDSAADQNLFRSLDNLRRASADVRANWYLPSGTVLTAGAALEQERDHSFNLCATQFGDCSTPPIDTARWNGAF